MFTSVAARAVRCPPKEGVSSDASGHSSPPDPSEVLPAGARAAGWGSNPPNRDTFGQGTHVNDAERLARDPAMRAIVGREGIDRPAASTSQMGRFETEWLATEANLAALTDLSGAWIDRVHRRRPPDGIILDMDSSESPTHGAAGGLGLERPLRLHLLPPAVRVQPVRRPGALRPAARQCSTAPKAGAWCWSR